MKLISKHLNKNKLANIENVDTICAFTGEKISQGIHKKNMIKDTFTDISYLKYSSNYIGLDVAVTMAEVIQGEKGLNSLRNYSFICNHKKMELLKNSEILWFIEKPIDPPFYFCISFSNKKHLAFKSKMNYTKENYTVTTDLGNIKIKQSDIDTLLPVLKSWYTVIPGKEITNTQPTYFTKNEILLGCNNYKKIEQYPGKFFEENKIIEKYRSTLLLKLLIHCLIKIIWKNEKS